MDSGSHILQVKNLRTYFHTVEGIAKAVDDVSFYLDRGETLGLVGESGCGKSVSALSVMRLVKTPPGRIVSGGILYEGEDLVGIPMKRMKAIRGKKIAMIFQEPMTSLNPVFTIGDQISEMISLHEKVGKKESRQRAVEMIAKVQIPSPEKRVHDYPHQLSGGMRQRAMIAMALACNPDVLMADEPTTALDVTVQAQIIDLMLQLQAEFGTGILLITHDLGVIAEIAKRIVVMYAGRVVEEGSTLDIFDRPGHPYTQGLLRSIPRIVERSEGHRERLQEIKGVVPSLYHLPVGCGFNPRCPESLEICRQVQPELIEIESGHRARCHLWSGKAKERR